MHDIEHHHVNVLDIDPGRYGRFDVVLALGLLYHVADPYLALTRCADLCLTHLLIESYCIDPHLPAETAGEPLMRFIADPARFPEYGSLNDDRSNFWGFTSECLRRMVADVGFTVERSQLRGERLLIDCRRSPSTSDTATRRGWTYGVRPRVPVDGDPDEPDAWTIF